jgi:hypothetical protein
MTLLFGNALLLLSGHARFPVQSTNGATHIDSLRKKFDSKRTFWSAATYRRFGLRRLNYLNY